MRIRKGNDKRRGGDGRGHVVGNREGDEEEEVKRVCKRKKDAEHGRKVREGW